MDLIRYFRNQPQENRSDTMMSVADPALAEFLGLGIQDSAGQVVSELTSLAVTSLYRCVNLIAGTIGSLPLKSYRKGPDDARTRITSFLDDPGDVVGLTPYAWKQLVMTHLLLHGNCFLLHVYNNAGSIAGLQPVHPQAVSVTFDDNLVKEFKMTMINGQQRTYTSKDLTHIMALSLDGIMGQSPIKACRNAVGTSLAGDIAASKHFANGLLLGGVLSVDGVTEKQAEAIKEKLVNRFSGVSHTSEVAIMSNEATFHPWAMSAEDGQFIESRNMQVEEISRIYGVPKQLLGADGASSWGTGIQELVRGFQRFTLSPWTTLLEESLSKLIVRGNYVEFDYNGLLQPSPTEQIDNMTKEIAAGTLTIDEARRLQNREPLPKEDKPTPDKEKTPTLDVVSNGNGKIKLGV